MLHALVVFLTSFLGITPGLSHGDVFLQAPISLINVHYGKNHLLITTYNVMNCKGSLLPEPDHWLWGRSFNHHGSWSGTN